MKTSALIAICAFAPAVILVALRTYWKSHPPDLSEAGVRGLQRGLKLGALSATALPLLFILFNFRPVSGGNIFYFVCAVVGNVVNLAAITDCLRELSGETLFAALILVGTQVFWVFYAFSVLMSAN
jgi:uncharacterized membrane protein YeaQ/YmgE (transglycosylase-associated protein family)